MENAQMRFKELRQRLGLTQGEIADKLGMHQTAWGRFETGKVPDPRATTIIHICKTLDISADWLLGLTECEEK